MLSKSKFMRDGVKFARAAQKPRAGQDVSTPPALTAQIMAVRKKIVNYGMSHGFPEELAATCSRMYPRFQTEDICRAISACDAQGYRNLAGFKNAMLSMAKGGKR